MRSRASQGADPAEWDVARPKRPGAVAGVDMTGFGVRGSAALRVIPHPAVMLVVEIGQHRAIVDDSAGRRWHESFVAGPGFGYGGAVRVRGEDIDCVQVRLSPVLARAVLGVGLAELDGGVAGLDDLWGREASRLGERLTEVSSWQDRFAVTDAWLARRHQPRRAVDPEVAWAWDRIVESRGLVRVAGLATELGWSRKRLWQRFGSQLGLSPKRAARLVRFDHAAHRLTAGEPAARVAAVSGYTDQSHLHRDIVAFAGTTPAAVTAEPWLTVDDVAWPVRGREPDRGGWRDERSDLLYVAGPDHRRGDGRPCPIARRQRRRRLVEQDPAAQSRLGGSP